MNNNENYFEPELATSLQKHTVRTFMWMVAGLIVTAAVALLVSTTNLIYMIYSTAAAPFILLIAQLGVTVVFVARLTKMSPMAAKACFMIYAVLLGVTFSTLGFAYDLGTLGYAFLVTAVYFGSLVAIGMTTKMNLLRFGPLLFGALISLIICEVIMMFMNVGTDTMLFSAIGLLIFTGITAYDAQKMKALYMQHADDEVMLNRLSIYSAFELYLDFINIFLYMLRFLGKRN